MTETFVVFDLETSGFHPLKDRVLEVGALHIDMKTLEVLGRFQTVAGCSQAKLDELNPARGIVDPGDGSGKHAKKAKKDKKAKKAGAVEKPDATGETSPSPEE